MSVTVKDLAAKLTAYALQYPKTEVMLAYDGDVAFEFGRGDDHTAAGLGGVETFLVLVPNTSGKKLLLKKRDL
ncbi:MAG: hypothetical protein WCD70_14850 [Alphaproteobacteria bacterium]